MSQASSDRQVTARIIYWGAAGAGKTTNLTTIHARLKADHRGELRQVPTRLDPTVTYEEFPIQLGSLNGMRTQLSVIAVPGAPELAHTRKQLLDRVDGVVLVLDCQTERVDDNLAAVAELRESLAAYGRSLDELPIVVQYNKRDLGDPYAIEEMHRRLGLADAAVFETIATDGTGILKCLTTISKHIVRVMRERPLDPEPTPAAAAARNQVAEAPSPTSPVSPSEPLRPPRPAAEPAAPPPIADPAPAPAQTPAPRSSTQVMEAAIIAEGEAGAGVLEAGETVLSTQAVLDKAWPAQPADIKQTSGARIGADLRIVSVGTASRSGWRGVEVPLVLGNDEGETVTLALKIQLEPLLDDGD
jgi:hypothetical protein